MTIRLALVCALALSFSGSADAQWGDFFKDKLKQQGEKQAGKAVNEAGDAAYKGAKDKAKGEQKGDAKPPPTAAAKGEPGEASAAKPGAAGPAAGAATDEVAAGEVYGNKFDFVPGDKVLLYDDFVETEVGDYPARWTIKEGGGNPVEVVSYKGRKWLKSTRSDDGINEHSMHWLRYDPKGDLPKKFTIEFDADMGGPFSIVFNKQHNWGGRELAFERDEIRSAQVRSSVKPYGPVVRHVSISVNGTYVKVYVGGARVLQDPDALERPITRIGFRFDQLLGRGGGEDPAMLDHQMITSFRLAEGGKDVSQALNAEGRIVVHGIYFATGSDVIQPESGGALRNILGVLQGDAGLRFRIEGHTDDQGGPSVNGPLSDRRAVAVKAWLVGQGVDAGRLETKGLGATKPIAGNDTQEGRANNRRVEFVRL